MGFLVSMKRFLCAGARVAISGRELQTHPAVRIVDPASKEAQQTVIGLGRACMPTTL